MFFKCKFHLFNALLRVYFEFDMIQYNIFAIKYPYTVLNYYLHQQH